MQHTISLERVKAIDLDLCLWFNKGCRNHFIKQSFVFISWLGNGKFWYSLMLAFPMAFGKTGLMLSLQMVMVGIAGLAIYKIIKSNTSRLRPCMANQAISLGTPPLDQYSFPSGHTLHAVSFSIIICAYYPVLTWILAPFTLLIALSRIVLGLHYPTDVIIGALIGFTLAAISFQF